MLRINELHMHSADSTTRN